jgi:DnaJ-class molecular chaperone
MSFFDHFFNSGFPGGHGFPGHEEEENEPVDTQRFYDILGVEKTATGEEINLSYKKLRKTLHPDRHPKETEKYRKLFQDLQTAYHVLKDEHKRKLYDKGGEKLVKQMGDNKNSRRDPFGFSSSSNSSMKKSPPIKMRLEVTLEDLYRGNPHQITVRRKEGEQNTQACKKCDGQGEVTAIQRMGPVMFQSRRACPACEGNGYPLKTSSVEVTFNVPVGGKHGESVTVPQEGHKYPNQVPGDLVVTLVSKKHELFTRQGADLGMNHTLTLREALCGYEIRVPHVSGATLIVTQKHLDEVVQPGDLKVVYAQGMPQRFSTHTRGNLYIQMEVLLPMYNEMSNKQRGLLKSILPKPDESTNTALNEYFKTLNNEDSETKEDINSINSNNSNSKTQLKGFFNKNKKGKNNNNKNKKNKNKNKNKNNNNNNNNINKNNSNNDSDELMEECEAEDVEGKPVATPATARGIHDEDEDRAENIECHQM